jgi:hypothetical protein
MSTGRPRDYSLSHEVCVVLGLANDGGHSHWVIVGAGEEPGAS